MFTESLPDIEETVRGEEDYCLRHACLSGRLCPQRIVRRGLYALAVISKYKELRRIHFGTAIAIFQAILHYLALLYGDILINTVMKCCSISLYLIGKRIRKGV
jgi:hypothetical protein